MDPPEYVETAKVFDMLLAVPKYGRVKVNKVLTQCRISPSKTIGGLSRAPARRARLAAAPLGGSRRRAVPRAVVITGPSGVGKGTLIRSLRERMPELQLSISATTRLPRAGETQGVDYHFMSPEEFERHVATATSSSTPTTPARATARCARSSTRGRAAARRCCSRSRSRARARCARRCPRPSRSSSRRRRSRRCARGSSAAATDSAEQIEARLRTAERELAAQDEFAHVVVNDRLEDAVDELVDGRRRDERSAELQHRPVHVADRLAGAGDAAATEA